MPTDPPSLTEGPLMKGLLRLAGPMFVSAMLQNAQTVIDLFWVGRLGSDAVAALALSGTILMMLFPVVMGLSTGTVAVVSRCVGARQWDEAAESAGQSLLVALVFGTLAGITGWFCAEPLCRLLGGQGAVVTLGAAYLKVSFLGSTAIFVLFIGSSILQASGNTVLPMYAMVMSNLLNLVLDPLFIFGWLGVPRLGVTGAAAATVIAEVAAVVVVLHALQSGRTPVRVTAAHWRLVPDAAWRIIRIGIPSSGQMLSRSLMSAVLMRIVAGCGMVAVAAYGIGSRLHMIVLMPAFTLGNAAATLVGQNLGAHKPERAARVAWLATGLDVIIMFVSAVVLVTWAPALIRMFDSNAEVVREGTSYLRVTSFFYVTAAFSIVLGRALQGAGDTVAPMITTIVGLWGVQVPLAILLSRWVTPPTLGIWWSVGAALVVNGLMVMVWFRTGRWAHTKV
jgi:putative MATE family efflux protein